MQTTRIPESRCPFCGHLMDAATGIRESDDRPDEDSATVCIECAAILFFNPDLTLRAPRPGEIRQLIREDPDAYDALLAGQEAVRRLDRR